MKQLKIIGLGIVCFLLLGQLVKSSRDRSFSRKLTGAWSWELYNMHDTNSFAPDGFYTDQMIITHAKSTNAIYKSGTWHIKDGWLFETVTSDTIPLARRAQSYSGRIVRLDASEFVVVWQESTNESVWQRVNR